MATVVYVHGVGNQRPAAALKQSWDEALFGAPAGTKSVMAYWADLRYPQPLPVVAATMRDRDAAAGDELDPADLVADTLAESRRIALGPTRSRPDQANHLDRWLEDMAYRADALVRGGSAQQRALDALPRPVRIAIFRELVKRTFLDVYAYFFTPDGEKMRARVRERLDAIDGPVIVIGHSLGSIIAYDVLRERHRDVEAFVTIGSPLAITEVEDLVTRPLDVPDGVRSWRNVADGRDLVALDPTIRPEYAPPDRTVDFLVDNDSPSHHSAEKYLATAPVRETVAVPAA